MAEDPGAVIHITLVPHGYEVDVYLGDDVPSEGKPSALTCRDFSGSVNTMALAIKLYEEIVARLQDYEFIDRFDVDRQERRSSDG